MSLFRIVFYTLLQIIKSIQQNAQKHSNEQVKLWIYYSVEIL